MKKLVLSISTFFFVLSLSAQDLITKIPSNAAAVVSIKGKRITNLVSLQDFSNSKLGQLFGEQLNKETDGKISDIQATGFDLNRNFYYFLDVNEGVFSNCFLIPLNNAENFTNLLGEREKSQIISENGYSYFQTEYDGSVTIWTDNALIFMFAEDQSSKYDDYGYYDNNYYGGEEVVIEEVEEVEETVIDSVEEDVVEEAVIESTETESDDSYEEDYNARIRAEQEKRNAERAAARKKRDAERAIKRKKLAESTLAMAKKVLMGSYANASILTNSSYMKSIGKGGEEANAWIGDFGQIYLEAFPFNELAGGINPYRYMDINKIYGGMTMVAKLDFEEDNVALRTQYTVDEEMAQWYKQMYDGKFNSKFSQYLNEDRLLGYWSMNMSVEGMLNAYPGIVESLFESKESNEYSDAVSVGVDLFSLFIDEAGIAEIIRGDALLAITDLSERTVTYTDYEYDEDYNRKEIEKTKTETVPDFLFMMTSTQKKLYSKLIRIGVREGELEAVNGLYKIKSLGSSAPLDVFLLFKDDMFIMGSSKRDMAAIASGTFVSKLSSKHKRNMKKNATSMYVNGKKIIAQVPTEIYPRELRDKIGFLTQNTEDVYFNFAKMKGNTMSGEMIWNTSTSGHQNSFDYFLNMIEALVADAR